MDRSHKDQPLVASESYTPGATSSYTQQVGQVHGDFLIKCMQGQVFFHVPCIRMNEEVLCDILCVCVSKLKHTWSGGGVIPWK